MLASELRAWIVRPVLRYLHPIIPYSHAAENLLLGTAAQESQLGKWLDQSVLGPGPAYGIYQMEKITHDDLWETYILGKSSVLVAKLHDLCIPAVIGIREGQVEIEAPGAIVYTEPDAIELHGNFYYATAMARVKYFRAKPPLPAPDDIEGMAYYWGKFYQTQSDPVKMSQFVKRYRELVES